MMSAGSIKKVTQEQEELAQLTKPPYKKTDFRYQRWARSRRALKEKARQNKFRVVYRHEKTAPNAVTVDTSKAKGSLDLVRMCLKALRWKEYPLGRKDGKACDIYWHGISFDEGDVPGGKVNKFPGMIPTMRKVSLGRMLDLMRQLFPRDYNFHPRQWFLPQQYAEFSNYCRQVNGNNNNGRRITSSKTKSVFIVKPDDGTQGEGIYLIHDATSYNITLTRSHVVQEYIAQPFLIDGLKFDFRVYVLLMSIDPLEVYVAKEGLARFCTVPYEYPTDNNMRECFMHLTNYSLNKYSQTYMHSEVDDKGSKRTMTSVFQKIQTKGHDIGYLWENIKELIVKTIIAILPELQVEMHSACAQNLNRIPPSCFQILGFDILLDSDCRPFLLEINANPSLRIDFEQQVAPGIFESLFSAKDEEIKRPVVMGALKLASPPKKQSAKQRPPPTRQASPKKSAPAKLESQLTMASISSEHFPHRSKRDYNFIMKHEECDISPGLHYIDLREEEEEEESDEEVEAAEQIMVEETEPEPDPYEQIYPDPEVHYESFRILERISTVFLESLGVRGHSFMGSSAFRNFTRRCQIAGPKSSLSNAALDIMYIELVKRWDFMTQESTANTLCFQGFLEAYLALARRCFPKANNLLEAMESFIDYCENGIENERLKAKKRTSYTRFPKISNSTNQLSVGKPMLNSGYLMASKSSTTYNVKVKGNPSQKSRQSKELKSLKDTVSLQLDLPPDEGHVE